MQCQLQLRWRFDCGFEEQQLDAHDISFLESDLKKVLFLSNLGVDMGLPGFRVGAYKNYLLPMAKVLFGTGQYDIRILANQYVSERIVKDLISAQLPTEVLVAFDSIALSEHSLDDFMISSYRKPLSVEQFGYIDTVVDCALGEWAPDVIICWEAPTYYFRERYKEALVLDVMPGMFMRPPFPRMLSFDPVGLYKDCWFSNIDVASLGATSEEVDAYRALRRDYEFFFENLGAKGLVDKYRNQVAMSGDDVLVPLQISDYFAWADNCGYTSQFDYLTDVAKANQREASVVCTQYVSGHAEERVVNDANRLYLRQRFPNFVHDVNFDLIDNVSQFLLSSVDSVCTVASTLGLQAKFFGKKLISPSWSHLSYIADTCDIAASSEVASRDLENFMAVYLARTQILQSKIDTDGEYLGAVIEDFYARRKLSGLEQLASPTIVRNSYENVLIDSRFDASSRAYRKAFEPNPVPAASRIAGHCTHVAEAGHRVVSFDVFDTLLARIVLHPVDVFHLVAERLRETHSDVLGGRFISNFVQYRVGAERLLRQILDGGVPADCLVGVLTAELLESAFSHGEEMHIDDVYRIMLGQEGLDLSLAESLVAIEQDIELQCLKPRPAGRAIFQQALSSGKDIVIISDFIHPASFVERALKQNGYDCWKKLYVSVDAGLKKHSGTLFEKVIADLGIEPADMLHFGDNAHGDIAMAAEKGISARRLVSGPMLVTKTLKDRKFNTAALDASRFTSAALNVFANQHVLAGASRSSVSTEEQLVASPQEFGFLVMGPIVYRFAKWLSEEADRKQVEQIVFFARDCVLPYRVLSMLGDNRRLCYVSVSRSATAGLNIFNPADLNGVRIDDFHKNGLVVDLLTTRFLLAEHEIRKDLIEKYSGVEWSAAVVAQLPAMVIYMIARESAIASWEQFGSRMSERRAIFAQMLEEAGVDVNLPTLGVDFGYKGTIHRSVECMFKQPMHAAFFMSYAGELGGDPIENAGVFYRANLNAKRKDNESFIRYNLMLETLMNEGVGSAIGYVRSVDGSSVSVVHDDSVTEAHAKIITAVHDGCLEFVSYWRRECAVLDRYLVQENAMTDFLFGSILASPTLSEVEIFADLVFDNGFAGHKPRRFVERDSKGKLLPGGVWPEGIRAVKALPVASGKPGLTKKPVAKVVLAPKPPLEVQNIDRVRAYPLVKWLVNTLLSKKLATKFERDPVALFEESKRVTFRALGRVVLR